MRLITASDYANLPRSEHPWVIDGLIADKAFHVLAGEPFCGKSTLALQMALSVSRGEPFCGLPTAKGPVLFYQFDTSDTIWQERLVKMRDSGVSIDGEVYFIYPEHRPRRPNILDPVQFKQRRAEIEAVKPKLVIIDNYRKFHDKSEDKSENANLILTKLKELTDGYTLKLIHHTKKPSESGMDTPQNLIRGSGAISGEADGQIVILENTLYTKHRLREDQVIPGVRRELALWGFPTLERGEELAKLCGDYPNLSHKQIAEKLSPVLGIPITMLRVYLDGHPCGHPR